MKNIIIPAAVFLTLVAVHCRPKADAPVKAGAATAIQAPADTLRPPDPLWIYVVPHDVQIKDYFRFMDTLIARLDTLTPYPLDEYLLVRANPWVLDTLMDTDYYRRMSKGEFVYNQRLLTVLHRGDTLFGPDTALAALIRRRQAITLIDVNIPEFRLRVLEGNDTLFSFAVRVGQNKKKYLKTIDRVEDLRTRPGKGSIIRVNKYPVWQDPQTGLKYKDTKRDDGRRTKLPQIPWLEAELDGRRYGQMLHPTTNPSSLGKAYSNGCVGCSEADAWRLYYYAPVGTPVVFRYDLNVVDEKGDTIRLKDIYRWKR